MLSDDTKERRRSVDRSALGLYCAAGRSVRLRMGHGCGPGRVESPGREIMGPVTKEHTGTCYLSHTNVGQRTRHDGGIK